LKSKISYIAILLLLTCSCWQVFGQVQKTKQFDLNDFLGEREFRSATQSDDLIIYFNTTKGILSYDGHDFKKINLGLTISTINEIQYFDNALYIASQNNLLQYFPDNDSVSSIGKMTIKQFRKINNQLWFITEDALFVWENNKIKNVFKSEKGEKFQCFEINSQQTVLGHNNGLTILKKGKVVKRFAPYLHPNKITSIDSITYILSGDAVLELNRGKVVRNFKNDTDIKDFYVDDFGKIWFIENQNILKLADLKGPNPIYLDGGKKIIKGQEIFVDQENNLWILGTNKLFKITQNNPFSKLFEENALKVYTGRNSNLIIKPEEIISINLIAEDRRIKVPRKEIPLKDCFAFQSNDGWIITLNNSIYSLDENDNNLRLLAKNEPYTPLKEIDADKYLAKDAKGDLFITDTAFDPLSKVGNVNSSAQLLLEKQKVFALSNSKVYTVLDSIENIVLNIALPDTITIENIIPAEDGVWHYTSKNLYKINQDGETQQLRIDNHLSQSDYNILNVFDDKEDNLWISLENSLMRFPIAKRDGNVILQKPTTYNKNDFIFSTHFKHASIDETGLIWFIHENGISIYNPLKEIPNLVSPSIKIQSAFSYRLDDFNNPSDTVILDKAKNNIDNNSIVVIDAQVISHFNNTDATIGYRNMSINQSERKVASNEHIILTDLADGLNTITLKAYNSNGIESNHEANINIYVSPPIWKQNWFYFSSIFSLVLLGFIGYRTVINIKNNRARELEEELHKGLEDLEKKSHLQVLKAERLKQLNELITSQKSELEKKNKQIESQKYELSLTNQQIKKQKDLLEETSSKLTSSINYAKRIQNALMSTEVEIKKSFDESFVYFLPRDVVSGDFFWFDKATNEKGEELLILAAVDCTGHGVPGAIVSVVGMNLLNNITKLKKIYDPGQILTEMNQDIISDLRQDETQVNDGMDMTLVTFNKTTKQLYFAGAKNPLMYIEDNELIRIRGDKHAIGGQQRGDERIFNTHQLDLTDGKKRTFYLFSDGYQDQFGGEKGFKYLVGNFKKLLLSIHDKDALEQKTILHEEIEDWKDGYAQTDDILVIGFKL